MFPQNRTPTHPGEVLVEEFLKPMEMTQASFAEHSEAPIQRVNEIVRGKRGISPDTAWLFSQALGTTPEFWLNLQSVYDLATHMPDKKVKKLAVAG